MPRHGSSVVEQAQSPEATLDLIRALEQDGRFRRDTRVGAIFHPGKVCFREISPVDSVHVVIAGDHVSVHVDEISPLVIGPDGSSRYSWGRVLAHNLVGALTDVARRLRGERGRQRCDLRCRVEWVDDELEAHCA